MFDVFFSYSTRDHAAVERIAQDLTKRGLHVFLDRWYLTAGQPWPQALEQTLAACGAVAVFIGADGLGPWQQRERDLALDRQAREPGFPVIPVLLTREDPGLGFLKLNTWVDLTPNIADPQALTILVAAIRREPPGLLGLERVAAVRAAVCPYRGLRPFREEDEPFFFGRSVFAETLTSAVVRQPFVAVVGASGSGKSSVVRAGLIPRLRRGAGGQVWDALTLVPTDRPFHSLAGALLPMLEPDLSAVDWLAEKNKLAAHFVDGTITLRDVAERVLQQQPGTDRLLLFVDQWEELYTLCADAAVRGVFVDHLLQVATTEAVQVVLTLRGDFMGHALANRALSDRLKDSIVPIGPMTRDELAETITRPAEKTGLAFEQGLVATILDDVGDEPGGLPLLEFLLEGLWAERRGSVLTFDAYAGLGRVGGAIAHRAEDVFKNILTEDERQAAQRLLMRMVRPGEGVEDTRRRAALVDTDAVADAAIQKLAAARLVVTERDTASGAVTAEVAHEALIRRWQRLRGWVDHDREFLRTRERIAAQARLWEDEKRAPDRLLPPGRPLAEGEDLLAKRRADLDPLLVEYIEASRDAETARRDEAEIARRRKLRNTRITAITMGMLAFFTTLGGVYAWRAKNEADTARIATETASRRILLHQAFLLGDRLRRQQARSALETPSDTTPVSTLSGHEGKINSAMFSPDGRLIATASQDRTARLWKAHTGEEVAVLHHEGAVWFVDFSPDGRTLVSASSDETARLWEVATGREVAVFHGYSDFVSAAFSPDSRTLVLASRDKTARLWEVATGKEITRLLGHENEVESVAFSPNGRTLATGSRDNTARLWETASGKELCVLRHGAGVVATLFDAGGSMLVTASLDGMARLFRMADCNVVDGMNEAQAGFSRAFVSPDRTMIVVPNDDGNAKVLLQGWAGRSAGRE